MENFNFKFENTHFFNTELNNNFSSKEELVKYFQEFFAHYLEFEEMFQPLSDKRMKGKDVKNYNALHTYSTKLDDHYGLLLTIGTNGFDLWLNNFKKTA